MFKDITLDLSKLRALAAEDDMGGGAMISMILRRLGIQTYIDRTGSQIVDMAREMDQPPDIIFLDLHLPEKSGFEIIQEIRADARLKSVLVIAVSAMDANIAIPKCRQFGFNGFIAKPLSTGRFIQQVHDLLSGKPVWEPG